MGSWLQGALGGDEVVGWCDHVLAGFLRIVTNRRIFEEPTSMAQALEVCAVVLDAPAARRVHPGPEHWRIFAGLCSQVGASGNDVPDAYLAALAIERGATFVTRDRGFDRFAGLRTAGPLT